MNDVNEMEINECKNVTDVLAAVSEGSNEVGVVYATDAASVTDKVDIIAEAPADSLQTPVLYPVGLIEDKEASDDEQAAEAFLDYVESDAAIKVFEDYGFTAYKAEDSKEEQKIPQTALRLRTAQILQTVPPNNIMQKTGSNYWKCQ